MRSVLSSRENGQIKPAKLRHRFFLKREKLFGLAHKPQRGGEGADPEDMNAYRGASTPVSTVENNSVYHVLQGVDIELYTKDKSVATEQLLEAKLDELNLVWNKYEEWLDSEECYEIIYSITI